MFRGLNLSKYKASVKAARAIVIVNSIPVKFTDITVEQNGFSAADTTQNQQLQQENSKLKQTINTITNAATTVNTTQPAQNSDTSTINTTTPSTTAVNTSQPVQTA